MLLKREEEVEEGEKSVRICKCVCVCEHIYACICMYIYMCVCVCVCVYVYKANYLNFRSEMIAARFFYARINDRKSESPPLLLRSAQSMLSIDLL